MNLFLNEEWIDIIQTRVAEDNNVTTCIPLLSSYEELFPKLNSMSESKAIFSSNWCWNGPCRQKLNQDAVLLQPKIQTAHTGMSRHLALPPDSKKMECLHFQKCINYPCNTCTEVKAHVNVHQYLWCKIIYNKLLSQFILSKNNLKYFLTYSYPI